MRGNTCSSSDTRSAEDLYFWLSCMLPVMQMWEEEVENLEASCWWEPYWEPGAAPPDNREDLDLQVVETAF